MVEVCPVGGFCLTIRGEVLPSRLDFQAEVESSKLWVLIHSLPEEEPGESICL